MGGCKTMVNLRDSNGRSLYFVNRKEYYRRKRISETKRNKRRVRQQYTINMSYSQSIRAICINGNATEDELRNIAHEFLLNNEIFNNFHPDIEGYEKEQIDNTEDKKLKDKLVYLEVNLDEVGIYELQVIR